MLKLYRVNTSFDSYIVKAANEERAKELVWLDEVEVISESWIDEYDVQEYLDMYELDSNGKDPISGYRELQKDKARKEAEERIKQDEKDKQDEWYQNDTKRGR